MNTRSSRRAVLGVCVALAMGTLLSGCFNPGQVVEGVVEQATGGDVDLGGTTMPEGFPVDDVPVIDGEILFGAKMSVEGESAWNVTIGTKDANALQAASTQLADAGFAKLEASMVGDDGSGFVSFSKDDLGVAIVVTKTDEGIAVNYTVTRTAA